MGLWWLVRLACGSRSISTLEPQGQNLACFTELDERFARGAADSRPHFQGPVPRDQKRATCPSKKKTAIFFYLFFPLPKHDPIQEFGDTKQA